MNNLLTVVAIVLGWMLAFVALMIWIAAIPALLGRTALLPYTMIYFFAYPPMVIYLAYWTRKTISLTRLQAIP